MAKGKRVWASIDERARKAKQIALGLEKRAAEAKAKELVVADPEYKRLHQELAEVKESLHRNRLNQGRKKNAITNLSRRLDAKLKELNECLHGISEGEKKERDLLSRLEAIRRQKIAEQTSAVS